MKKKLLILFITFTSLSSFAQIEIAKISPDQDSTKLHPKAYDSTKNYLGKDYKQYIGQQLYCLAPAIPEEIKDEFCVFYKKNEFSQLSESPIGKYFQVIAISDTALTMFSEENELSPLKNIWFKLKESDNGKIIFYNYNDLIPADMDIGFNFIVVGYYERLRKLYSGRYLYIQDDSITGHDKWLCKSVAIDTAVNEAKIEAEKSIKLSLENGVKKHSISYIECNYFFDFIGDKYISRFGIENWNKILDKQVEIGWTIEMVRLSLGRPYKVNTDDYGSTWTEQWVYGNNDPVYYYFDNGKLTAIQNR